MSITVGKIRTIIWQITEALSGSTTQIISTKKIKERRSNT